MQGRGIKGIIRAQKSKRSEMVRDGFAQFLRLREACSRFAYHSSKCFVVCQTEHTKVPSGMKKEGREGNRRSKTKQKKSYPSKASLRSEKLHDRPIFISPVSCELCKVSLFHHPIWFLLASGLLRVKIFV
jgi:hypothetical protein